MTPLLGGAEGEGLRPVVPLRGVAGPSQVTDVPWILSPARGKQPGRARVRHREWRRRAPSGRRLADAVARTAATVGIRWQLIPTVDRMRVSAPVAGGRSVMPTVGSRSPPRRPRTCRRSRPGRARWPITNLLERPPRRRPAPPAASTPGAWQHAAGRAPRSASSSDQANGRLPDRLPAVARHCPAHVRPARMTAQQPAVLVEGDAVALLEPRPRARRRRAAAGRWGARVPPGIAGTRPAFEPRRDRPRAGAGPMIGQPGGCDRPRLGPRR